MSFQQKNITVSLVNFSLLIFFGVFAQVVGDITRLVLYQRGF